MFGQDPRSERLAMHTRLQVHAISSLRVRGAGCSGAKVQAWPPCFAVHWAVTLPLHAHDHAHCLAGYLIIISTAVGVATCASAFGFAHPAQKLASTMSRSSLSGWRCWHYCCLAGAVQRRLRCRCGMSQPKCRQKAWAHSCPAQLCAVSTHQLHA
jgi:hypothetical protein